MKINCAIFSAIPEELESVKSYFSECKLHTIDAGEFKFTVYEYKQCNILVTATGIGTTFAAMTVTLVHEHFHPDFIFYVGTAGGMHADAKLRNVIIAEKAFEAEIQSIFSAAKGTPFETSLHYSIKGKSTPTIYSASTELLGIAKQFVSRDVHIGTVVTSNTFPAPLELFQAVKAANVYAIDMETSAFYQAAWLLNVQAIAIRGISNVLNHDGTDDKIHESDIPGSTAAATNVLFAILHAALERTTSLSE